MRTLAAAMLLLVGLAYAQPLDGQARAMLDPIREEALHPRELVARLKLAPDAVVADVGAGPGFFTLPLARAVPRGRVIAVDIRADYLALAERRTREAGLTNVETRTTVPDRPNLEPHSVDAAFMCQVDHYLKDRVAYFAALAQSLRPNGRIVLVNYLRYREPDLAAARQAKLRVVEEWNPSPPFFVLVLKP